MSSPLTPSAVPEQVLVHPLVLLSVVDHYRRAALAPGKRVLGVLLGYWTGKTVNVTNSYACNFTVLIWSTVLHASNRPPPPHPSAL